MTDDLLARDRQYVLRPWSDDPLMIVEASDCTVTDSSGKTYVDFTAGYYVNNVGHCHPAVAAAATRQIAKVTQVSGKNSTPAEVALAEKLVNLAPKPIAKALFTTGGSESNEFALKLVRQKTGKPALAALDVGYHGLSLGTLELCGNAKYRATAGIPLGANAVHIPAPYCYRCPHNTDCDTQCLDETERILSSRTDVGALIAEPIQAVGGIIPSQRWWDRMNEIRHSHHMMLIADEVMAGIGRTGKMFSSEHYGLQPDILTAAKGISGGIGSLGVMMCSDDAAKGFAGGTTPTNAANAVSCAAGVALLDVIANQNLLSNAAAMGDYLISSFRRIDDPWIGDIRFKGLLGGVEIVTDRATKAIPSRPQMEAIRNHLQARGILLTLSGPHGNQLRIQPPLTIQPTHIDALTAAVFEVLPLVRA